MGVFKVNGTDILDIADIISTSRATSRKSVAFSSGKLNVTGLSDSEKTLANAPVASWPGWFLENIVGNKLKVNGDVDTVSKKGCRPILYEFSTSSNGSAWNQTSSNKQITLTYNPSTDSITVTNNGDMTLSTSFENGHIYSHISVFMITAHGGGGGGGGSGVGKGGGGGGGAGAITALINFKNLPGNKLVVTVGHGGSGGASTGSTGVAGSGGSATVLTDGNNNVLCMCHGGYGGVNGGGGQGGGSGGGVEYTENANYFKVLTSSVGGAGGSGGGTGNNGTDSAEITYVTPDATVTQKNKLGGPHGASGNNRGGGGGAGGTNVVWSQYSYSGGKGADDNSNAEFSAILGGGGGGAGGTAIFNGRSGSAGAGGMFRVYYGKDI